MSRSADQAVLSVSIKQAVLGDADAIVDLWRSAGMLSQLNDPREDLQFALTGDASTVLLAVDKLGSVIGSVMVGHDGHRGQSLLRGGRPSLPAAWHRYSARSGRGTLAAGCGHPQDSPTRSRRQPHRHSFLREARLWAGTGHPSSQMACRPRKAVTCVIRRKPATHSDASRPDRSRLPVEGGGTALVVGKRITAPDALCSHARGDPMPASMVVRVTSMTPGDAHADCFPPPS